MMDIILRWCAATIEFVTVATSVAVVTYALGVVLGVGV